jgi:hypothetical protein
LFSSSHYFAVFFFYFTADRNAPATAGDDGQMTSFMYIVLILNIVVVITTIGSVLLLTRKIRILVPKIMQSVKASANVRRKSSISRTAPCQADAALLAGRRASTVSTTKQAKPLGGEEQLAPSKAMNAINAHNEMKERMLKAQNMAIELSSSENEDSGEEEAATLTRTYTQDDTPRTKSGQPIS